MQKPPKKAIKKQKAAQGRKRITLEELFRRREKEEELLSTSRTKRSLQLTFEGLVVHAKNAPESEIRLALECEVTLYKVKRDHKKRKLNNGHWDACEYKQIHRSCIPLLYGDIILNFRIYALNSQSWPPLATFSPAQKTLSSEHSKLNAVRNVDCVDIRRILCNQISVIENGRFCKDGQYDVVLRLAREQGSIIPSDWKIRFTLYWDCKVHLPLRPMEPKPHLIPDPPKDVHLISYIYRVADCELTQHVRGFRCPWCSHLCFTDKNVFLVVLIVRPFLLTQGGKQLQNDRIIIVTSNEEFSEFEYFQIDKRDGSWTVKPFIYPLKQYTTPPLAISSLPTSNFYHSHTFMPFKEGDPDSEDETCTHWLEQLNDETLDELSDVSDKEKQMMKIWNRYIEPKRGLADKNLSSVCIEFAKSRAHQIVELDLRNEFAFHLLNILEFQIIDSACVTKCLGYVDKLTKQH
ncbi:9341_t:CDS:2 [Acaulospora colombiana]|uniref:9341_t:CDS:1 n=1 Tax=Acaulospora colombiana TaxID=27376 RepID=A0ACA9K8T8_9GLOM|nr:9341_t:CDS:2 [Acaulospora colombiana]